MTRYLLKIEYDGRPFCGWQRQENGPSVQQAIEEAIHSFCQEKVVVMSSGRTDAGVHAKGMHAHVDIAKSTDPHSLFKAINALLRPHPIAIVGVQEVTGDFHARFSCIGRAYQYRIVNRRAPLTFDKGLAWNVHRSLSVPAMRKAASYLVGSHDFTSFRAANCQAKSPIKTLDRLDVYREGQEIIIEAAARSFLYHQIRNFAGSHKEVGEGKFTPEDLKDILEAKDRTIAGMTAPSDGLYFMNAFYRDVSF